ncbi:hypothetical protein [Mariniphaga sediminis]|uniref:hypothetical protein n=1 Tax=Mariniphaga sediminis TaxID=1628158 RepID=UPI003566E471
MYFFFCTKRDKICKVVPAGAYREAQSIWNKDYNSQQEAQKGWAQQAPEAYDFRNNKNRLKGYSSEYWRKLHRKQSSNQDDVAL